MKLNIDDPLFYRLTFDRLLKRTFLVLRHGGSTMLIVSLIILLPGFLLQIFALNSGLALDPAANLVNIFVNLVLSPLATGALVYSVFLLLREQPIPGIGRSLSLAGGQILHLVVASIFAAVATFVGFLLCIVPGFIVLAGLMLVSPVIMVEKVGPLEALNRSWELSEGYRWPIFAMLVLIGLAQLGFAFGIGAIMATAGFLDLGGLFFSATEFVVTVVATAVSAAMAGVAYHDLRLSKEELGEDELLAVFE